MNIERYSFILSVLVLLLGTTTILSVIGYFFVPKIRERIVALSYTKLLELIGVFATIATLGALTYQFVYALPVCPLCWWQRIFMFPIEIIIFVTLWTKTKANHLITGIMAVIGSLFALNHYYAHYQKYVMGNPFYIPCSVAPGEASCANAPLVTFGFITIPFMALIVFATIIWLSYLAHQKSKESLVV
ncbi:MAG: disulfide bond formation protein B [Candidatus Moranbacteria bacterium]|nr:disulfide bond formation protein B [Candidatus Moranbacteria bacterium]